MAQNTTLQIGGQEDRQNYYFVEACITDEAGRDVLVPLQIRRGNTSEEVRLWAIAQANKTINDDELDKVVVRIQPVISELSIGASWRLA